MRERAARVAFIVATSARWSESERARREDIDLERGFVLLRGSKTATSTRLVPVLPRTLPLLALVLDHARDEGLLFEPWLNVRRDLHAACKRVGTCPTGKRCYRTSREAAKALRGLRMRAPGLAAFRCQLCVGWHLGRGRPAKVRVRRERLEKRAAQAADRQIEAATSRRRRKSMKKVFAARELLDMELPFEAPEGGAIISDKVTGKSRWSTIHTLIFRLPGQPETEAWLVEHTLGATEGQDEGPWQHQKTVEATLVRQVEKLMKVWESTPEEASNG